MRRKKILVNALVVLFGLFLLAVPTLAQVDFCEGDFDHDGDNDGSDASAFKSDFGRSQFTNPCPCCQAPVPKTGQTTSYASGDDGNLQKGVAWPNPRFTDNGNGTVTDNLTGLIWLKNANCFGTRTWDQAISDCNGLASGSCGLTDGSSAGDWRLPTRNELNSLVCIQYMNVALCNTAGTGHWSEGDPFTNVPPPNPEYVPYITSSTYSSFSGHAWIVEMNSGAVVPVLCPVFADPSKYQNYYVWPVRGGH